MEEREENTTARGEGVKDTKLTTSAANDEGNLND